MDCPAGLRYNYTINQCDWPANVPCDQGMCCTITPIYYQVILAILCVRITFLSGFVSIFDPAQHRLKLNKKNFANKNGNDITTFLDFKLKLFRR